jgi:ribonucleoside-diphosphate reductase alpha chain
LELEGSLSLRLRDGITTKEIQDNLINCALEKCSLENPDWRYVAGRLHMWGYNQDVLASRGYGYTSSEFNPFVYHVVGSVHRGLYRESLWQYSRDELVEAQSWINPEWDYDYDYAGAVLLTNRYLQKDELIQEAYLTTALIIASVEDKGRLKYARQFYEQVASRKISLATPILANLRAPGGNGTSCFIHTIDDNLESIFDEVKNAARISKNGGGVGTNLSKIRAAGSTVMGRANGSGGVIPWVKILNDTAVAVNQGGKRSGAITVSLDIWHLDILEFLEMQTENGDQRRKAYDVFPQVVIPDLFMKWVEQRKEWTLFDPYEVKQKLGYDLAELCD